MRVLNIIHDSIVDGPGLRTTLFVAGCPHHCKGCHNEQSWDVNGGIEMSIEEVYQDLVSNPLCDITFSGGEPFLYAAELSVLAARLKAIGKNIWCYTGYTLEYILKYGTKDMKQLTQEIDTLVDGPFVLAKRDLSLLYRGSSNQRILHMK